MGRADNFGSHETIALLEKIKQNKPTLLGKLKGLLTKKVQEKAWAELEASMAAQFPDVRREAGQYLKKFNNLRTKYKPIIKEFQESQRKTGGGKAAPQLDTIAQLIEDLMGKDNPQFRGVQSGIDTSNDLESDDDSETVIPPTQNQHYSEATTSHQNTPLRSETSTTASVPQARRKIAPKRILPQVQSNEELTRDVLLLQKEVYTLKKQKLELQLEELRHNKRMRDTRPTGNLPPTPIMTAQVAELPAAVAELAPGVYEAYDLSFQDTSYRL